jgi:mono/diheme cytochrome c family protein
MLAWVRSDPAAKKAAYEANRFPLPDALKGKPLTAEFRDGAAVKVRDLIDQRCQSCHTDQAPSLGSWAELEPRVTPPARELVGGKWVRSTKQISVEALTQSTHAHLLSFAVLFTLTGLVFSFTSYPAIIRGIVAPVVLVAQVADIACWWLARLDGSGPYFAAAIVMTGGVVGTGLMLQIVLGLFDLYGWPGKLALVGLFAAGAVGFGVLGQTVILPALEAEREAARVKPEGPKPGNRSEKANGPVAEKAPSRLERLVMGDRAGKWNGDPDKGSMVKAFYEKSDDFKDEVAARGKDVVEAERDGERLAVKHWINLPAADRKRAYDDDKLPLPTDRAGKPLTAKYQMDDKTAKVRSILADRCVVCHGPGGDRDDLPLHTYADLLKYIDEKRADGRDTVPTAGE